jgi:hypothetical protein
MTLLGGQSAAGRKMNHDDAATRWKKVVSSECDLTIDQRTGRCAT